METDSMQNKTNMSHNVMHPRLVPTADEGANTTRTLSCPNSKTDDVDNKLHFLGLQAATQHCLHTAQAEQLHH